jgi:hypothetical protein
MAQLLQRFAPECSIHAVPGINVPQFLYHCINDVWSCITVTVENISYQVQEHFHDVLRVGKV